MEIKRIAPEEAQRLIEQEGYQLLDVRSEPEFAAEHPRGAYNIPYLHKQPYGMVANPDFMKVVEATFPDRATKLITADSYGPRSLRAAADLATHGYPHVLDLRGGLEGEKDDAGKIVAAGWKAAGLPLSSGDAPGRSYASLQARVAPTASPSPAPAPGSGHGHGHGHGHAPGPAATAAASSGRSRFADASRTVECRKLGRTLPALKRRPMGGPLGERIFREISADAWERWAEHSKLLINEYRLNPAEPKAQELLLKQCEAFLFGEGAVTPDEFRPTSGPTGSS